MSYVTLLTGERSSSLLIVTEWWVDLWIQFFLRRSLTVTGSAMAKLRPALGVVDYRSQTELCSRTTSRRSRAYRM